MPMELRSNHGAPKREARCVRPRDESCLRREIWNLKREYLRDSGDEKCNRSLVQQGFSEFDLAEWRN